MVIDNYAQITSRFVASGIYTLYFNIDQESKSIKVVVNKELLF